MKQDSRRQLVIGGGLLLGMGVGLFLLPRSGLYFAGSMLAGLGLGLLLSAFLPGKE